MKNDREFSGTLLGFDDFVSPSFIPLIVSRSPTLLHLEWLANASLLSRHGLGGCDGIVCFDHLPLPSARFIVIVTPSRPSSRCYSETTPQGKKKTELNQTLLNGNNICLVSTPSFVPT